MKKIILLFLCICISKFSHAADVSEKQMLLYRQDSPPAYVDLNLNGGSSSNARRTLAEEVGDIENRFFLDAVVSDDVQEILEAASIYKTGDQNFVVPKSLYDAIALYTIATTKEVDGEASVQLSDTIYKLNRNSNNLKDRKSYMAHAAYQKNQKALSYVSKGWVAASGDLQAELFAQIIKNESTYTLDEKYGYAKTLLTGTDKVSPQHTRAIAIAMLLARKYPNEWHGHELMMHIANGHALLDGVRWDQYILPPDYTLAKKHAEMYHTLANNPVNSLTWLGCLDRKLGNLEESKAHIENALQKDPNCSWTKRELALTQKEISNNSECCTIL